MSPSASLVKTRPTPRWFHSSACAGAAAITARTRIKAGRIGWHLRSRPHRRGRQNRSLRCLCGIIAAARERLCGFAPQRIPDSGTISTGCGSGVAARARSSARAVSASTDRSRPCPVPPRCHSPATAPAARPRPTALAPRAGPPSVPSAPPSPTRPAPHPRPRPASQAPSPPRRPARSPRWQGRCGVSPAARAAICVQEQRRKVCPCQRGLSDADPSAAVQPRQHRRRRVTHAVERQPRIYPRRQPVAQADLRSQRRQIDTSCRHVPPTPTTHRARLPPHPRSAARRTAPLRAGRSRPARDPPAPRPAAVPWRDHSA